MYVVGETKTTYPCDDASIISRGGRRLTRILAIFFFFFLQVFYTIGFGGMTYCVDVLTADASQLKNRGLAYAFTSSPYIITAFAGPAASDAFYTHVSWRWGFGAFAIIFPIAAAPLCSIIKANLRKAKKVGNYVEHSSGRTLWQSIWYYIVEFDGTKSQLPPPYLPP